jgi:hypothetical protein
MFSFQGTIQASGVLNLPSKLPPDLQGAFCFELRLADQLTVLTMARRTERLGRTFVSLPRSLMHENFGLPSIMEVKVLPTTVEVEARQQIVYPQNQVFGFAARVVREGSIGIYATIPAEYMRGMLHLGWEQRAKMRVDHNEQVTRVPDVELRYYTTARSRPAAQIALPRRYFPDLAPGDEITVELRQ